MATTDIVTAIAVQLKELWFVYLVVAIIGIVGTWMWYDNKTRMEKFAPEIIVRKKAYYKRKAVARLVDKGGREYEFIVKKDADYPGTIENKDDSNDNATLREPSIVSARARGYTSNGVPIYTFFVGYDFPMPYRSATAITELNTHIRTEYPELNWLGDVGIIQGVFNSTEYAYDDCVNLIQQYVELGAEIPEEFFQIPEDDDPEEAAYLPMGDMLEEDEIEEDEQ